jgi:hypothetical protein
MTDYRQSTLTGNKWRRCFEILIKNPFNGQPAAIFQEQDMADFNNQILELGRDTVSINVSPEKEITILDPTSGLETGQKITHGELYAILYSAYIGAALERDQRIIDEQNYIPPEPVPPPGPSEPPF